MKNKTHGRRAAQPTKLTRNKERAAVLLAMICAGASSGKRVQA